MAAVDYVALNRSLLHYRVSEGTSRDLLDVNESSLYFDCPWRDEQRQQQKPSTAAESSRPYMAILGSDRIAYDPNPTTAPTTTIAMRQEHSTSGDIESMTSLLPDDVTLDSWQLRHPDEWTCGDVLDLIYFIAMQSEDIEFSHFYGENFQNVNGAKLRTMDEEEFVRRDPKYGRMIHGRLRDMLRRNQFHLSREIPTAVKLEKEETACAIPAGMPITVEAMSFGGSDGSFEDLDSSYLNLLEEIMYDIDPHDDFSPIQTTHATGSTGVPGANSTLTAQASANELQCDVSPPPSCSHPTQLHHLLQSLRHRDHLQQQQQQQQQQRNHQPESRSSKNPCHPRDSGDLRWLTGGVTSRQSGVTSMDDASSDGDSSSGGGGSSGDGGFRIASNFVGNTGRLNDDVIIGRTMNGGKGNHLWEFLCQQLQRSETMAAKDRIIQWESKEEGVFRIIDSKEVASQWGLFKGNDKMTYEKLSRALRWCRTNGFLATLPKNGRFPKKLCFRFGQKATNWKDFL